MKTIKIFGVALSILFSTAVLAQEKSTSIKVSGNCGMCKKKIETAAKAAGATSINWDSNKQAALVKFDPAKVSIETIQSIWWPSRLLPVRTGKARSNQIDSIK